MQSLNVFTDFAEVLDQLSDAEAGRLFKVMLRYATSKYTPDFRGNERFVWPIAKLKLDRDWDKYDAACVRNKNNRAKALTTRHHSSPLVTKGDKSSQTKTETETIRSRALSAKVLADEFEQIWADYPRKEGKKDAQRHYSAARKRGVTFEQIQRGVIAYRDHCNAAQTETQFIKQGSTYFCGEHWNDVLTPVSVKPAGKGYNTQPNDGESELFEAAVAAIAGGNDDAYRD